VTFTIQIPGRSASSSSRSTLGTTRAPEYIPSNVAYVSASTTPAVTEPSPAACSVTSMSCTFTVAVPLGVASTLQVNLLYGLPPSTCPTIAKCTIALATYSFPASGVGAVVQGTSNTIVLAFQPVLDHTVIKVNALTTDPPAQPILNWQATPYPTPTPLERPAMTVALYDASGNVFALPSSAPSPGVVDANGQPITQITVYSSDQSVTFAESQGSFTPEYTSTPYPTPPPLTLSLTGNIGNFSTTPHLLNYSGGSAQDVGSPSNGTAGSGQIVLSAAYTTTGSTTVAATPPPFALNLKQPYLYITAFSTQTSVPVPVVTPIPGLPSNNVTPEFLAPPPYAEPYTFGLYENLDSVLGQGGAIFITANNCYSVIDVIALDQLYGYLPYTAGGSYTNGAYNSVPLLLLGNGSPPGYQCQVIAQDSLGATATININEDQTQFIIQGKKRK